MPTLFSRVRPLSVDLVPLLNMRRTSNSRRDAIKHEQHCPTFRRLANVAKAKKMRKIRPETTAKVHKPLNAQASQASSSAQSTSSTPLSTPTPDIPRSDPNLAYTLLPDIHCQPPIAPMLPSCASFDREQLVMKMANRTADDVLRWLSDDTDGITNTMVRQDAQPRRQYHRIAPRPQPIDPTHRQHHTRSESTGPPLPVIQYEFRHHAVSSFMDSSR